MTLSDQGEAIVPPPSFLVGWNDSEVGIAAQWLMGQVWRLPLSLEVKRGQNPIGQVEDSPGA